MAWCAVSRQARVARESWTRKQKDNTEHCQTKKKQTRNHLKRIDVRVNTVRKWKYAMKSIFYLKTARSINLRYGSRRRRPATEAEQNLRYHKLEGRPCCRWLQFQPSPWRLSRKQAGLSHQVRAPSTHKSSTAKDMFQLNRNRQWRAMHTRPGSRPTRTTWSEKDERHHTGWCNQCPHLSSAAVSQLTSEVPGDRQPHGTQLESSCAKNTIARLHKTKQSTKWIADLPECGSVFQTAAEQTPQ